MISSIALPREIRIGAGAIDQLPDVVIGLGSARPLLITDGFLASGGAPERLVQSLAAAGLDADYFDGTVPDPTTASLESGLRAVRDHGADLLIGFGGGSPMDTAKALALLAVRGGTMRDYKAPLRNDAPGLPVVAVPTTAGSGSEATQFTIITDSESDEKMLCIGRAFLPVAAIVDYELTLSMPARLTADTGIDALTHAVEAYVSRKNNTFSDDFCLRAISAIGGHLRRVYADGTDHDARSAMMQAALHAGIAFSNSSVALVHGMSRPIGAHFHLAHGLSNAMLFPAVTRFSLDSATQRYADCARALGCAAATDSDQRAAGLLVDELTRLSVELAVPTPALSGIAPQRWDELIPLMARQAIESGSPANNPRVPSVGEIEKLYSEIYR
ncbi:iron-containing alcohol dehydrogenase [Nocardia sp. 348MFTsu5.1]|uniref:iron-containing alcohol dehydrogenase n=1 Tax=Nocardia sp. 348MFTsu5.1 TaxID=1172185 RepID=UPI000376E99F|nr:iron-containing alcohol dehydrogenase [Nocardia sp. 348MFTsu5.1]